MQKHPLRIALLALGGAAFSSAIAGPVSYEMDLTTASGMGSGGATGMMGALFGGGGGSASHQMMLRLTNPTDIPDDYKAEHTVPNAMRIGPKLTLKGERRGRSGGNTERDGDAEGKVLIYWGCSATVPKGQPEVIDLKALGNRVSPEVAAMARQQGRRGGSAESLPPRTLWWPSGSGSSIPNDASAVGEHVVTASFMSQEIRYSLDKDMDFLDPMNLKANNSGLKDAIPLQWDKLSRAKGFNLNAMGSTRDKEVILWMAAKGKNPMLPGSQTTCTIPAGIFAKTQGAMAMGEAIGPTKGFAYPPKKPPVWTVKVRVTAHDGVMLGMGDAAKDSAADSVVPGGGLLRGIFGK